MVILYVVTRNTFPTMFARQAINRTRGLTQVAHKRCGCLLQISEPSTVLLQGQHNIRWASCNINTLEKDFLEVWVWVFIFRSVAMLLRRNSRTMLIMETLCILMIIYTRKIIPRCIRIKLLSGVVSYWLLSTIIFILSTCLERGAWMAQLREPVLVPALKLKGHFV